MKYEEYTECMDVLVQALQRNKLTGDFWKVIDLLPSERVYEDLENLLKLKILEGKDYLMVVDICHRYKYANSFSVKQKRASVIYLLKNWDDISIAIESNLL